MEKNVRAPDPELSTSSIKHGGGSVAHVHVDVQYSLQYS